MTLSNLLRKIFNDMERRAASQRQLSLMPNHTWQFVWDQYERGHWM